MYGLSEDDLALQNNARAFTDELIPYEEYAEMHDGELPEGIVEKQRDRAIMLGLYATNIPTDLGGRGCSSIQQVLVQEQAGRVTNALGWVLATPPLWWVDAASDYQKERWLRPTVRGEMAECYAITEEDAGSDVAAIKATARRDGDGYLLNGVKWHVTSFNTADF